MTQVLVQSDHPFGLQTLFYVEKRKCDRAKGNCPEELCSWLIRDVGRAHLWYEFGTNRSIIDPRNERSKSSKRNKIKNLGEVEVRLDLSLKDALFIYLSEYVTFRMSFGVERCQNYKKLRKIRI